MSKRPTHVFAFLMVIFFATLLLLSNASKAEPVNQTSLDATPAISAPTLEPAVTPEAPKQVTVPLTAPAKQVTTPSTSQDPWWKVLLGGTLQIVLLFVAGIATPLGVILVKILAKKAKITNLQELSTIEHLYLSAVDLGINFATQQCNKLGNNPDAKAQRIKWATDKVLELIKEWNLPEKASTWVIDRIESRLGEMNGTKSSSPPKDP